MDAYNKVHLLLGFLVQFPSKTDAGIKEAAQRFRENYSEDIEYYSKLDSIVSLTL